MRLKVFKIGPWPYLVLLKFFLTILKYFGVLKLRFWGSPQIEGLIFKGQNFKTWKWSGPNIIKLLGSYLNKCPKVFWDWYPDRHPCSQQEKKGSALRGVLVFSLDDHHRPFNFRSFLTPFLEHGKDLKTTNFWRKSEISRNTNP